MGDGTGYAFSNFSIGSPEALAPVCRRGARSTTREGWCNTPRGFLRFGQSTGVRCSGRGEPLAVRRWALPAPLVSVRVSLGMERMKFFDPRQSCSTEFGHLLT